MSCYSGPNIPIDSLTNYFDANNIKSHIDSSLVSLTTNYEISSPVAVNNNLFTTVNSSQSGISLLSLSSLSAITINFVIPNYFNKTGTIFSICNNDVSNSASVQTLSDAHLICETISANIVNISDNITQINQALPDDHHIYETISANIVNISDNITQINQALPDDHHIYETTCTNFEKVGFNPTMLLVSKFDQDNLFVSYKLNDYSSNLTYFSVDNDKSNYTIIIRKPNNNRLISIFKNSQLIIESNIISGEASFDNANLFIFSQGEIGQLPAFGIRSFAFYEKELSVSEIIRLNSIRGRN